LGEELEEETEAVMHKSKAGWSKGTILLRFNSVCQCGWSWYPDIDETVL
jgi:hypothetical protein